MSRKHIALTAALVATAALVVVPTGGAGADTSCVAWASLPSRVALSGSPAVVRSTLRGTSSCRAASLDAGAHAVLDGPGGSTSDYPMLWTNLGDEDTATMYASVTRPGTYRISGANLQTYDARDIHIPNEWRTTETVVKYAGRFAGIAHTSRRITATLQFHDRYEWRSHGKIRVILQRRTSSTDWHTVASTTASAHGRVSFASGRGQYRLISSTSRSAWRAVSTVSSIST